MKRGSVASDQRRQGRTMRNPVEVPDVAELAKSLLTTDTWWNRPVSSR
jgi:hypothetical protein